MDKSGVSDAVLSLPNGGGGIQPLGTSFSTDLNTGTGGFSIPLDIPTGPNGVRPTIILQYQSTAGNGPFGVGWTIGLPAIARKTDGNIPRYAPDDGRFTLIGDEDLVDTGDGNYRTRIDTSRWRLRRDGASWSACDSVGQRYEFGGSSNSRVEDHSTPATAMWLVDSLSDTDDNTVKFSYREDGAQRYVEQVSWGTYRLLFAYEDRPDACRSGRYGFLLETRLRCSMIELHVTTEGVSLVRSWKIEYYQTTQLSLLTKVTMRGHGPTGAVLEAPSLAMSYTALADAKLSRLKPGDLGAQPALIGNGTRELVDWNGDGLPDLLEVAAGSARVWPNIGNGRWGLPRVVRQVAAPVSLSNDPVLLADATGSGTADLLVLNRVIRGYYPLRAGGGFGHFVTWRDAPDIDYSSGEARLVDLDGDGVTDMLVTGRNEALLFYRQGRGWRVEPQLVPRSQFPPVSLSNNRVHLADMTGDGMQDLVLVDGAGVTYWQYLGFGRWLGAVRLLNSDLALPRFDPARLFVSDIDGDGCADLIYVDAGRVLFWLNESGLRLGPRREVPFTPLAAPDEVRIADMLGNGTNGVLWSRRTLDVRSTDYFFLDISGGTKPYLLSGITSGLGASTEISYAPSTTFAIADADADAPWQTFCPFPVHCVSSIVLRDAVAGLEKSTVFHYHEGRYDPDYRTFLGFARVDQTEVGDTSMPSALTRNTYHVGLDPEDLSRPLTDAERQRLGALRRRLLQSEITALDGSPVEHLPYGIIKHEYEAREEIAPNGGRVFVPILRRTLHEKWEREKAPFAFHETAYERFDDEANNTFFTVRTWRAGEASPDSVVSTETRYARNAEAGIFAIPARITKRDANGQVLSDTLRYYDGAAHVGLPLGQVAKGHLTRQEVLVLTNKMAAEWTESAGLTPSNLGYHQVGGETGWWITQVSYDRDQLKSKRTLLIRNTDGSVSSLFFDESFQYVTSIRDSAGNVQVSEIDRRVCRASTLTDANGNTSVDRFDELGRVLSTYGPLDSSTLPTVSYEYKIDHTPAKIIAHSRVTSGENRTLDRYEFFSPTGRRVQQIEPAGAGNFLVSGVALLNRRGLVRAAFQAFSVPTPDFSSPPANQPRTQYAYDPLGRVVEEVAPSGARVRRTYGPGQLEIFNDGVSSTGARRIRQKLDAADRVLSHELVLNGRTVGVQYRYDQADRLVSATEPSGGISTMSYDLIGRMWVEVNPATGPLRHIIDSAGNLRCRILAGGGRIEMSYDAASRLTSIAVAGGPGPDQTFEYLDDGDPVPADGMCNRIGRLWRVTDQLGVQTIAYDAEGRTVQISREVAVLGGHKFVMDFELDALGRRISATMPAPVGSSVRRRIDYGYNERGVLYSISGAVTATEYDLQGHLVALNFANGTVCHREFDPLRGRPVRDRLIGSDGSTLRDHRFTYDETGNLLRLDTPAKDESEVYVYDDMDRLISWTSGADSPIHYAYDDAGNIIDHGGPGHMTYSHLADGMEISEASGSWGFNVDGFLSASPQGRATYDVLDRLEQFERKDGTVVRFRYGASGRRLLKETVGGARSIEVFPEFELYDDGAVCWSEFGGTRIASLHDGTTLFMHSDIRGSTSIVTDGNGRASAFVRFDPYGNVRLDTRQALSLNLPIRFCGNIVDVDTGLVCAGVRYYSPSLGRFVSPDRIVPGLFEVDCWNRYSYAHNNPIRYVDVTGRISWKGVLVGLGVAAAALAILTPGVNFIVASAGMSAEMAAATGADLATHLLVGTLATSVAGAIAAGHGGRSWVEGAVIGALVGGVSAGLGAGANVLTWSASETTWHAMFVGAVQGLIAGSGTGAAIAVAGGRGSFWDVLRGAYWGALSGAALGLLSTTLKETWQGFSVQKIVDAVNNGNKRPSEFGTAEADTVMDLMVAQPTAAGMARSGPSFVSGISGDFQNMVSADYWKQPIWAYNALFNMNVSWVPYFLVNQGGIQAVVTASETIDHFSSFGYITQIGFGIGAVDLAGPAWTVVDAALTSGLSDWQNRKDLFKSRVFYLDWSSKPDLHSES